MPISFRQSISALIALGLLGLTALSATPASAQVFVDRKGQTDCYSDKNFKNPNFNLEKCKKDNLAALKKRRAEMAKEREDIAKRRAAAEAGKNKAGHEPARTTGSGNAGKHGNNSGNKPGNKDGSKTGSKSGSKDTSKTGNKSDNKVKGKTSSKADNKPKS